MTFIDWIIPILWAIFFIFIVYWTARLVMKAWLTEIDLYINKMLKKYLSKIEKEHEAQE